MSLNTLGKRALKTGVVIAAGGAGTRFGGKVPKQFALLDGKPILQRTLETFEAVPEVGEIVLVAPAQRLARAKAIVSHAGLKKVLHIVAGGKDRQDSVWNGLQAFSSPPEIILVHDAVRPLVTKDLVSKVIRETQVHKAVVVALQIKDTVKVEGEKGFCVQTLDRSKLWAVQTPQGFQYDILARAHRDAKKKGIVATDDAALVERLHIPVRIVEGSYRNIKITTKEHLEFAKIWLTK